jgi:hypothetical protein
MVIPMAKLVGLILANAPGAIGVTVGVTVGVRDVVRVGVIVDVGEVVWVGVIVGVGDVVRVEVTVEVGVMVEVGVLSTSIAKAEMFPPDFLLAQTLASAETVLIWLMNNTRRLISKAARSVDRWYMLHFLFTGEILAYFWDLP